MKGIKGTVPYNGALIYKQWHKKECRWYAIVYWNENKRTTKSWARYLMETHLGRFLAPSETVDHIDGNKTNDVLENLQILTIAENVKKSARKAKIITIICDNCGELFQRNASLIRKKQNNIFCKPECRDNFASNNNTTVSEARKAKIIHGTINAYAYHKCRCLVCKEGRRIRSAAERIKAKLKHSQN